MALSLELDALILVFLVVLSGFFSASELSIFSLSRLKLRRIVASRKMNAELLAKLKENPQRLLLTILIGNDLANIAAASFATAVSLQIFPSEFGIAVATGVMTFVILVFGDMIPKSLALRHNEFISLNSAPFLKIFSLLFAPLIFVLERITGLFVGFASVGAGEQLLTEEEVKAVVSIGAEEGGIKKEEKEMIHRIFRFDDTTVESVMTPRSEIVSVGAGTKIKDISPGVLGEHSRLPVYKGDLDEIVGVFHARDYWGSSSRRKSSLIVEKMMRPVMYVVGTRKIDKLLKEFQRKKNQLAIVVDEYGGTIGLVTIEDLLEEIVGEIEDEADGQAVIKKLRDNEFLVEGAVSMERLNKVIGSAFKSDDYGTVAGLVLSSMDKVPKEGDHANIGGIKFVVEKMDGPKIEILRVVK